MIVIKFLRFLKNFMLDIWIKILGHKKIEASSYANISILFWQFFVLPSINVKISNNLENLK